MHDTKENRLQFLGIIIIIIGVMIGFVPMYLQKEIKQKEQDEIEEYIKDTSAIEPEINQKTQEDSNYLMILEIPTISLRKGIYPKESALNNIEKNVTIMQESGLPSDDRGNVILEAHNGTSAVSYFNKLDKMQIGDEVYLYYQGTKYIYKADKIYDSKKNGNTVIDRDFNNSTLTLITCKKNTDDMQIVIILYLTAKETY